MYATYGYLIGRKLCRVIVILRIYVMIKQKAALLAGTSMFWGGAHLSGWSRKCGWP